MCVFGRRSPAAGAVRQTMRGGIRARIARPVPANLAFGIPRLDGLALRLPVAVIHEGAVHQDDRSARTYPIRRKRGQPSPNRSNSRIYIFVFPALPIVVRFLIRI